MLDEAIQLAAEAGAHEVVIGMAHRGRLNVLAHVDRPARTRRSSASSRASGCSRRSAPTPRAAPATSSTTSARTAGASTPSGEINVTLAANPSHLEAVDPVVEGRTRADQTDRSTREGLHDPSVALPILIHGDAAFPAQGVVAETLNLSYLDGYATGGTLHLITNNQVGFTTEPEEGRSTRYSSDLAKGFDAPIIHVNADDPEAAISAVRLALAFRRRFCNDVVIDLVGYRRHGHNEQDEPAYTQPLMARASRATRPCATQFAERLVERGHRPARGGGAARRADARATLRAAHERLKESIGASTPPRRATSACRARRRARSPRPFRPNACARWTTQLLEVPEGFTIHPKLLRQLERRRDALERGRHRLGPGGGARLRVARRRGDPRPADRPGHRARHVLAPPPRPARRRRTASAGRRSSS